MQLGYSYGAVGYKFTGKERDAESGLDYFGARYDASSMGRFMTPDPLPWAHWQNGSRAERRRFLEFISNPQNFNMYSYVRNNPTTLTDPDGMDVYVVVYTTGNSEGDEQLKRAAQTKKDQITSFPRSPAPCHHRIGGVTSQ
jgi:RHS repeat-associated protein